MTRTTLAVLAEQIRQMQDGQDQILHIVQGNGRPGLVDKVAKMESDLKAQGKELTELSLAVKNGAQALANQTSAISALQATVTTHLQPENLQHATIAKAMVSNPQGTFRWLGWGVAVLLFLVNTPAGEAIAKLFTGAP